jgi:hypothetical protein
MSRMEKTLSSQQATDWREGRRLRACELKQEGWKQLDIARALGVSKGAVSQWMKRAATARGNPRPARFLRGPIVRHTDPRPPSARPLAHAAGHAICLRRWRRGSPDPNREACRSLPGPLAGCTAEKAASIATPTSDRRCVGCPPLVRWIRSAVPSWRWKQVRSD